MLNFSSALVWLGTAAAIACFVSPDTRVLPSATTSDLEDTQASVAKMTASDISATLAGFKLKFPSSLEPAAPRYVEFFYADGRWLAEIPGRVTLNHHGRWRAVEDRVCVDFKKEKSVCRRVSIERNGNITLSHLFSGSDRAFRVVKSKI